MTEEPTVPHVEDPLGINDEVGIGHNNPPEPMPYDETVLAELKDTSKKFVDVSNLWLKADVTTAELAGQLGDQIDGLRKLYKRIDDARTEAKAPYLKNGKTVDDAFNPIKSLVRASAEKLKPKLSIYLAAEEEKAEAEKAEAEKEAQRAEDLARVQKLEADNSGKIEDQVAADEQAKAAAKQVKAAAKPVKVAVKSSSGAGRTISARKRNSCEVTNIRHLFMYYQDREEVHELLLRLANAEANSVGFKKRGDDKIPGVTIKIETSVA